MEIRGAMGAAFYGKIVNRQAIATKGIIVNLPMLTGTINMMSLFCMYMTCKNYLMTISLTCGCYTEYKIHSKQAIYCSNYENGMFTPLNGCREVSPYI